MGQLKKNRKFQISSFDEFIELLIHSSRTKIHELMCDYFINDSIEQYSQNNKYYFLVDITTIRQIIHQHQSLMLH
jgi:hypothetical protein